VQYTNVTEQVSNRSIDCCVNKRTHGLKRQQAKKGKWYRLTRIAVARGSVDRSGRFCGRRLVEGSTDRLGRKSTTGTTLIQMSISNRCGQLASVAGTGRRDSELIYHSECEAIVLKVILLRSHFVHVITIPPLHVSIHIGVSESWAFGGS
jgi:hypothetical protein